MQMKPSFFVGGVMQTKKIFISQIDSKDTWKDLKYTKMGFKLNLWQWLHSWPQNNLQNVIKWHLLLWISHKENSIFRRGGQKWPNARKLAAGVPGRISGVRCHFCVVQMLPPFVSPKKFSRRKVDIWPCFTWPYPDRFVSQNQGLSASQEKKARKYLRHNSLKNDHIIRRCNLP